MEYENQMKRMQVILDELNGQDLLPEPRSPEAKTMGHKAWMSRFEAVVEAENRAINQALLTVPAEIDALMEQIRARKGALLRLDLYSKSSATANKGEHEHA